MATKLSVSRPTACELCGKRLAIEPSGRIKHYCSDRCRITAHRRRKKVTA